MRSFVFLVLLLSGCGGALADGKNAFRKGRYAEARTILTELEPEANTMSGSRHAEYTLYRGLTHLALGNRPATLFWLGEVKRAVDANPTILSDEDTGRLASAWAHLESD